MSKPTSDFTHLWNDLPYEERERMMPYMIESQKLHLWQCKKKAIEAHKAHMTVLNDWMANLDQELSKLSSNREGE